MTGGRAATGLPSTRTVIITGAAVAYLTVMVPSWRRCRSQW